MRLAALALVPLLVGAGPAPHGTPGEAPTPTAPDAGPLVLNCYVVQMGSTAGPGQFVRHVEVHPDSGTVSIADSIGGATPRWLGNGRLVTLDADHLVYDFASSSSAGRTEIDRHGGSFTYRDGRVVIEGSCQPSTL